MRKEIIKALKQNFESQILMHKINVDVMLSKPMAIPEHTDLMDAIEKEVAKISEYMDKLEVLDRYFSE
jgi:hypothetical protein